MSEHCGTDHLGIDIGQKQLVMALLQHGKVSHRTFRNDVTDFEAVSKWLDKHKVTNLHVCVEATGTLWEAIAYYLHEAGHRITVANPARIHYYAQSLLRRNKTDKLDADCIVNFCASQAPEAWTPPRPVVRSLRALVRLLEDLHDIKSQQVNRRKSGVESDLVLQHLDEHIRYLDAEIAKLQEEIRQVIDSDELLAHDFALLLSIKGVGFVTAAVFLAEDLRSYHSVRAATAHAGLNPKYFQSGHSVHRPPHISKVGSARFRKALYMPALSAMRFNPCVKALADRLRAANRPNMVIVVACMRKLLALAYGVLKSGVPFDPNYAALRTEAAL